MGGNELVGALRLAAPQGLTSIRILLGMWAILLASGGRADLAAELLLLALCTDAVDGPCARKLGSVTEFGKLFDYFADYMAFVVAPAAVALLSMGSVGAGAAVPGMLPCVFAALRYARKARVSETEFGGMPGSPGVPTVAYTLFVVAVILLRRDQAIDARVSSILLIVGAPVLAGLMMVRTRYPKLSARAWILVPVLVGLALMPFLLTTMLASMTLALITAYATVGPWLVAQPATERRSMIRPPTGG